MDIDHFVKVAKEIALNAGKIIIDGFYKEDAVTTKEGFADLVTVYDKNVEKYVFEQLRTKFPSHKFIGEESANEKNILTDEPTWVIDPIDGTTNFVHGFPNCALSMGLLINKKSVFGLIYNPVVDETFIGIKGKGAFLNDKPIHVNKTKELNKALVFIEFGFSRDPKDVDAVLANMKSVILKAHGVRSLGSAALNMSHVACGRADAYWEFGIHVWDFAAGVCIVEEAGGYVCSPNGEELDYMNRRMLCAATPQLAKEMCSTIQEISFHRD